MKNLLLALTCTLLLIPTGMRAAKTVYIPDSWVYDSSTQEYTEGGNSDLQWSYNRSLQSDNCIIFWQKGFGTNPNSSSVPSDLRFDPQAVLDVAEQCYAMNVNTLGFSCSNMLNKYKIIILMNYTTEWTCYGGGYDFECSALWLNPSTVHPAGHSLAHEVGHSFHYMCYAEAANYSHTSSSSINTGFHLACGNGQAIWEQTAQWQANQTYPDQMFPQSYPLFGNCANYAFSHEWMRYQSYWFHYYLAQYYNDITTVAQVWKTPMTGQSNGNATDFCQAYIKLKGLTAAQFYERYFDYAMRCATFDFDAAASYRNNYIGNFDYHAVLIGEQKYQVAYHSVPQSTGFNVIELNVPSSGTTITTKFTALTHGCALADDDPATYNNGVANSNVAANVTKYNSAGTASYRGFRVGYVFLKSNGTREYYNDNTVHCTGTAEKTEEIATTVPANTSRIFLVVAPALSTYVKHSWDENIANDDQWPYSFELVNTDVKNATIVEKVPEEPAFTKQIDGRSIADVTLTYKVTLPPTSDYTGATVTFNTGSADAALCTAFQLQSSSIFGNIIDYTASQSNGTIMSCALTSSGGIQAKSKNTNGTFGHWFNASGTVVDWGNSTVAFTEINDQYTSGTVGEMPDANSNGTTRTIREGLIYKDSSGKTAKATIIFNITFKNNAAPSAYLSDIDYTKPTVTEQSVSINGATAQTAINFTVTQGETSGPEAIDQASVRTALNNLGSSYLTSATYFKGYYDPLTSATAGVYVYYYAIDGTPTATANTSGTMKYYQVTSVTNDTDLNGQYTHYFDTSGKCIAGAAEAAFKVGYDRANAQFTVYAADDCTPGTYTINMAMARRYSSGGSTYIKVAYFPITITVTQAEHGEQEETLNVERFPGMGYTVTEANVDLTAATEYLGVDEVTTDMLYFVNPDGTKIDYATYTTANYDGWCDADGVATNWGNTTKICVKFFQAIPNGTYQICDMNGADQIGTTYTVKWALVANGKTYIYNINVTFVEKPAAEFDYNDLNIKGTQDINITSELGNFYEGYQASVDIASILSTLGVSSLNDVTIYAVQSDNQLDDNYNLGGTDGWRNADGDWQGWGDAAYFYVKADFAATENQLYQVGGMEGKNLTDPTTYTATYAFVKTTSAAHDAVVLHVNLIYNRPNITLSDTQTEYTVKNANCNVTLQRSLPTGK